MDYDVFISCKSEDYKYAEEVYDFLKGEGVNVFLASRELRRMKESEYMRSISKALDTAYHLIVFASDAENLTSKWVEFEWSTFLNEKLSGFKDGQIMTILYNVSVRQAPLELRHYESFTFENYKERLLSYVETPAYLERKEEEKKRAQEIADARKKQEEEEKKRILAKQELIQLAKDYTNKNAELSTDAKEIESKMRLAGITHRICPVCQTKVELSSEYCPTCGWTLSPIEGIEGAEYLLNDKSVQINLMKSVMDKPDSSQLKRIQDKLELSQQEIEYLKKKLEKVLLEKDAIEKKINTLNLEKKQLDKEISELRNQQNKKISHNPLSYKVVLPTGESICNNTPILTFKEVIERLGVFRVLVQSISVKGHNLINKFLYTNDILGDYVSLNVPQYFVYTNLTVDEQIKTLEIIANKLNQKILIIK